MSDNERDDLRKTDEDTGVKLRILYDSDAESPVADDESVILAIFARNHINPAQKQLPTVEMALDFVAANRDPDSEYAVFAVWAYEHGNIVFKAVELGAGNPYADEWDSGNAGIIALKRTDFGPDLLDYAKGICATYTDWCNGEVYGYVVENEDGDVVDSCWGYVGDPEDNGALTEGLSAFESVVEDARARIADAAQAEADKDAAMAELLAACAPFAEPNDTPASQRLKEALEEWGRFA